MSFLFSIFGLFSDLLYGGVRPYVVLASDMAYCGAIAILWLFSVRLLPLVFLIVPIAIQIIGSYLMALWDGMLIRDLALRNVDGATGIRVCAFTMMAAVILSYVFFILFIRSQGRDALKLRTELELAHGIQKTLVPPFTLRAAGFEVYGISMPSEKVGGDLVDAIALSGGDAIAYLGDIAGHGLQAGILMGMLKTATRTALVDAGEREPCATLPALLERLNTVLPSVKEPHMYATFTAFRLCVGGDVFYSLAASPPILHWHSEKLALSKVEEEQFPLGLLEVSAFTGDQIAMRSGDLLLVATDGVLEACDRAGEEFGLERLERTVAANATSPLPELAAGILDAARAFGKQADDQTILLVRRLA
ncbi:MAG TPA: PP2C family protein-serine/threonine phosphatase [Acidobacteriaceae bacterium]|nr:PP2C family protein-serine/threonine phosphatase [Acidobacteriaceae bacterium]